MDGKEEIKEPKVEMTFQSEEEVFMFYANYAMKKGFGVIRRSSKRDDDGNRKYFTLACAKAQKGGSTTSRNLFEPKLLTKTECKAKIRFKRCDDGTYKITTVELSHDHQLSPGEVQKFPCSRKNKAQRRLEINDRVGNDPNKNQHDLGGYENVTWDEDGYNSNEESRHKRLGADIQALCKYFAKAQESDPNFFYVVDIDDDARVRNLFWADGRSKAAYECFSDVVTFDTAYLTNKYEMPLAPFVGVNHHGQSLLFGCGLLTIKDTKSFVWLFQSWLNCMSGCHPKGIITDQCKAIQVAVEIVFPDTKHRWCLGHIMKKLPDKLKEHSKYEEAKEALQTVVYDSLTEDEFDNGWSGMIDTYDLTGNDWLEELYKERHRWVPAYVKHSFWAGMSITRGSENMNAFFNGHVNSKTTLKLFVEQYDKVLESKVEKENQADFQSFNSWYECLSNYEIENQFQRLYTNEKFKEFQDELKGKFYCYPSLIKNEDSNFVYEVAEDVKVGDKRRDVNFTVNFNESECEVNCNCCLFELRGILCRHALSVLILRKVNEVHSRYILSRWRKDLKRGYAFLKSTYNQSCEKVQRCEKMYNKFHEFAILAANDEEKYKFVMDSLQKLKASLMNGEVMRKKKREHVEENNSSKSKQKKNSGTDDNIGFPPVSLSSPNVNEMGTQGSFVTGNWRKSLEGTFIVPRLPPPNLRAPYIPNYFGVMQTPIYRGHYIPPPSTSIIPLNNSDTQPQ